MEKDLYDGFTSSDTQKWIELLNKELKGKDYKENLIWHTREGISLEPFYRDNQSDAGIPSSFPFRRSRDLNHRNWEIDQEIWLSEGIEIANRQALAALNSGASSITFVGEIQSGEELKSLLKEIGIQFIEIRFRSVSNASEVMQWLIEIFSHTSASPMDLRGAVENDPIRNTILTGISQDLKNSIQTAARRPSYYGRFRTITVDASIYHNSGATIVEELAFALAHGHEYINALVNNGVSIDDAASMLEFRFATSPDFYFNLSKFRAFKELWSKVVSVYKPQHACSHNAFVIAETSRLYFAHKDPYTNLLRSTTEAFSAIVGGTDAFSIRPFDGEDSEFSQRMGRNIQLLLREEAHLDKIVDPAGGSYFIEHLTEEVISKSWNLFREIESDGGILSVMNSGKLVARIEKSAEQLRDDFRTKKIKMIGVNVYPDPQNKMSTLKKTEESSHSGTTVPVLRPFLLSMTEMPTTV